MKKSTPQNQKNDFAKLLNPSPRIDNDHFSRLLLKPPSITPKRVEQSPFSKELAKLAVPRHGSPPQESYKQNRSMVSESLENFNFSNYCSRVFEGENWKVPGKAMAQRHSRELVFSNLPGGKITEEGFASFDRPSHLVLPANISIAEHSLLETKRSHEVINQMNSNNDSFHSKLPIFPVLNTKTILNTSSAVLEPGEETLRQLSAMRDTNPSIVKNTSIRSDVNDKTDEKIRINSNFISKLQSAASNVTEIAPLIAHRELITPDSTKIEEVIAEILTVVLDNLLGDELFSIFFIPERRKGIQTNYHYIKFYTEKLIEYVLSIIIRQRCSRDR